MKPITTLWPAPPGWKGYGYQFYRRVGKELVRHGVLTELDKEAFLSLCETYHQMRDAADALREHGTVIPDPVHGLKRNPASMVYKSACDSFSRQCREFHLTPNARLNVSLTEQAAKNGKEKYFA